MNNEIDFYINNFDKPIQQKLEEIRTIIGKAAPKASEKISYAIPAFYQDENIVHFAGYKSHIGFYPGAAAIKHFAAELIKFKTSKGTIQFPIDQPIPKKIVTSIVKFRLAQLAEKKKRKK